MSLAEKVLIEKAGPSIVEEYEAKTKRFGQKIPVGTAIVTDAGNTHFKKLIQVTNPTWCSGEPGKAFELSYIVRQALLQAESNKCLSVAIPAISSGSNNFPKLLTSQCLFHEVIKYALQKQEQLEETGDCGKIVKDIRFTNIDDHTVSYFVEEFDRINFKNCKRLVTKEAVRKRPTQRIYLTDTYQMSLPWTASRVL